MVAAKKWIYARAFQGLPTSENFRLEEETLPTLKENEILAAAEFISVDPYMRPYMDSYPAGSLMIGAQVAKIIESRHAGFPVGSYVYGHFGWRTHTVANPDEGDEQQDVPKPYLLPDFGGNPRSLALGTLGMPGNTAFFGFLDICKPKQGETVVISGAAGAVGHIVGQMAKIKGCRTIGIAGSDDKCRWLQELGFDATINYKTTPNLPAALKEAAPDGVDCYFDNVGGFTTEAVRGQMNRFGRISVCGSISDYNTATKALVTDPQREFVWKQLRQEGFVVWNYGDRWFEGIQQNLQWIQEGKLQYKETVTDGFEKMPTAFVNMLTGGNVGKAVVKI